MCRAVTLKARSVQEAHKNFEKHFLLMIEQGFFDILFTNIVKLAEYAHFKVLLIFFMDHIARLAR